MILIVLVWAFFWSVPMAKSDVEPMAKAPPVDPAALSQWWKSAGQLRMGDTAYRAKDVRFKDGVCDVQLEEGFLIPVYTGKAPVSEKMVGVIFTGAGTLAMRFPERADAWSFANHMTRFAGKDEADMRMIAQQKKPYSVSIDQGLILSADPKIPKLIYDLEPVGGGIYFSEQKDGEADATYVVTERRGNIRAKAVATNVLAIRSEQLQQIGLDPRAMLRQDRLLLEELGFPGHYVRAVGDYRTSDRFHVAAQGTNVSSMDYDRWMTCYRDGRDEANVGYRSMAFAHGIDLDKRRHFQRFSGLPFLTGAGEKVPRPPTRMEPVQADSVVEFRSARNKSYQKISVDTKMTVQANGTDLQYIALRLPTQGSRRGSWVMEELTLSDGSPLAWVGLNSDLSDTGNLRRSRIPLQEVDISNEQVAAEDRDTFTNDVTSSILGSSENINQNVAGTSGVSGLNSEDISIQRIEQPQGAANIRLRPVEQTVAQSERRLGQESEYTYDIIALLPEVVEEGKQVEIHLKWSADWQFSNMSTIDTPDGVAVRTLGTTTGVHPILPEILPAAGGTRWNFTIKVGTASPLFRPQNVVASGDTVRSWQDEGLWKWVETTGNQARNPSVGVGRWEIYSEPPVQGLPGINVHLFPGTASKSKVFGPEIRRILTFYHGFLPNYQQEEVDLFQNRSLLISEVNRLEREQSLYGAVQIQTIAPSSIGLTDDLRKEDAHRAQTQIARQLASQYWGQRLAPNSGRASWITQVLSDAYAAYYIRAAFGTEEYEKRMTSLRMILEDPEEVDVAWTRRDARTRSYSPAGSTRFSDVPEKFRADYALYVLSEMLRLRIGNQAYFSALEVLGEEEWVNTELLQSAFEQSSKQELNDFFDYWIYGGYIPSIKTSVRYDETGMFACIESDVPFGVVEVPVRIQLPESGKTIDYAVSVQNGEGSFFVPNVGKEASVSIDPLYLLLAFDRKVTQVSKKTACKQDPKYK